jgi:hypothetical protein
MARTPRLTVFIRSQAAASRYCATTATIAGTMSSPNIIFGIIIYSLE